MGIKASCLFSNIYANAKKQVEIILKRNFVGQP